MRLRTRRVDPGCGWAGFSVSPVTRAPGFFFDLGQQTLRYVPESGPARSQEALPSLEPFLPRLDDTFWLPLVEDDAWRLQALTELRSAEIPRLIEAEPGTASERNEQEVVVEIAADVLLGDGEAARPGGGAVLVVPWVAGFTARSEVWRPLLDQCLRAKASGLVLIRPDLDDSAKRELARRGDDRQYSALFHAEREHDEAALRAARAEVRAAGLATVIERALPAAPERLRRNRRVAAALLTVSEAAEGFGEARREEFSRAARWIANEQRDLLAIAADGNLKVLDWLPEEAHRLVLDVLEAGDGFRLASIEQRYCSSTPM